jgi:hypothetical protein
MHELKEMLKHELDRITKKGELSAGSLDLVDKITHSIKSIDTIEAMEGAGYSSRRRDSMGRYADYMDDNSYYNRRGDEYSRRGYSRDKDNLVEELRDIEHGMQDEESKAMIRKWIKQVQNV